MTPERGTIDKQVRAEVKVDWERAPRGDTRVPIEITGPAGARVVVQAVIANPGVPLQELTGFVESNGYVSFEAEHFDRAVSNSPISWQLLPNIGRTA